MLDKARETAQAKRKIGTTGRGIGPAYIDKARRVGIRIVDLLDRKGFESKLRNNVAENNEILEKIYGHDALDVEEIVNTYLEFDKIVDPYITDTTLLMNSAIREGSNILIEGAQGALLDIDHGTYPYVTSSNPISGGACTGLGIPPTAIDNIVGIVKAYCTRVGNGPFPTELDNEDGERLRRIGAEFGATTGRPRRCGWLDLMALRYSAMINGITEIALTKLDVLDELAEIKVCTGYKVDGKYLKSFPVDIATVEAIQPQYESLPGWNKSLKGIQSLDELPRETLDYFKMIEEFVGVKIKIVSLSPDRADTIVKD
jgi:adenylosuccinate synthase